MKKFFDCLFSRLTLILIIIGIGLFAVSIGDTITSFKTAKTFEDVFNDGIEEGDYIKGEVVYSFGVFAVEDTVTKSRTGSTHTEKGTAEYFIIPAGKGFAGLEVRKKLVSDVEKNSNETYDVLDGKANDTTTRPVIEGKVQVMKSELASYYKSGLKDMGYTSEEIKDMGEIYVIKTMSATTSRIMTIIGLLAFIAAIVVIIVKMNKTPKEAPQMAANNQMNGGYVNPNYNNQMNGGYTDPNYNNQMNGGYTDPNYNNQMNGGYTDPNYNNQMNGGYTDPNYNNQMNGGYTDPNYNNQMNNDYTNSNNNM